MVSNPHCNYKHKVEIQAKSKKGYKSKVLADLPCEPSAQCLPNRGP